MIEVSESRGRRAGPRRGLLGAVAALATVAGSLVVAQPASALPLTNLTVFTSTPQALSLLVTYNANGDDTFGRYVVTADGTDADTLPDSTCEDLTADVGNPDTCTISGLTADQPYTITLEARATGTDAVLLTKTIAAGASTTPLRPIAPGQPTAAATGVSGQVKVSWTPSVLNTGATLAPFTATAYVGSSTTVAGTCTSTSIHTNNCLVNGLTNDNLYTFTVVANGAGTTGNSLPSVRSLAAGPGLSPAVPTNAVATVSGAGAGLATVSWTAPTTGTTVASYTVKGYADGVADATFDCTATAPSTTCVPAGVVALSTVYTFTVTATGTNGVESATASAGPAIVIPAQVPGVPTTPTVTGGDTQATVTWVAPTAGAAVSLYRVTATAGAVTHTCTTTALTCTLTGLTNATPYTVTVASIGGSGNVSAEEATVPPTVTPATVPKPVTPSGVTLEATDTTIDVAWATPAASPAVPVVYYTATASPGGKACATVSGAVYGCTISGLTPETEYTVTVVAKGASSTSAAATATATTTASTPTPGEPGPGSGEPTGPVVVNPDGKEQIFTRGTGVQALWTAVRNTETGAWEDWTSLGGPLYSDPVPVRNTDGKLQVFVLDVSGFVTYKLQGADGKFGDWKRISMDRSIAKIVAAKNANGSVQIFGRSGDHLYTAVQTTGADAWSAWVDLGYPVSGDPTVVAMADGTLEVFTAGHLGAVYRRAQTAPNATTWTGWVKVAPSAAASEFV